MLHLDILSAFVICGAASCVAASMMALVRPDEGHLRAGLRICSAAFLVLGVSLFQAVFGVDAPDSAPMLVVLVGSSLGVALFAWGLARLNALRVHPFAAFAVLGGVALVHAVAARQGAWALSHAFVATMTLLSLLSLAAVRRALLQPAHVAERILGLAMLLFAASWLLRAALTLHYDGPLPTHHIHVPPAVAPVFAIFYGVMPIFLATVVLNVINAGLMARLERQALTDELTGVMTRRALRDVAPAALARARAAGTEVAVLMLDIDHFKQVNDRHGHLTGDDVLREVARTLRAQLRADALVTRYGGEEFALVVPVADLAAAQHVAERLRLAVATRPIATGSGTLAVTVSVGLALLGAQETLDAALLRADEARYRAKHAGRDRVEASLGVAA